MTSKRDILVLRTFISSMLSEARKYDRRLRVFDFDDTLVKTRSMIHVVSDDGKKFDLTPGEFAVYEAKPGDIFDFEEFSKLIDPQEIKWTGKILKSLLSSGSEVVILTARAAANPVHQFMREAGLPAVVVIALADGDPKRKSDYIDKRLAAGDIDFVEFFDDSYKNIEAVKSLQSKYPDVKIVTRHVVHKPNVS